MTADLEPLYGEPKSRRSRRLVALDRTTIAALNAHRLRQLEQKLALGPSYQGTDVVFARRDGRPYEPDEFSREFDRKIKKAGVPRIRLHDLRHTWATLVLQAGIHPKVVSERLGHSTIAITLDTYSHVDALAAARGHRSRRRDNLRRLVWSASSRPQFVRAG